MKRLYVAQLTAACVALAFWLAPVRYLAANTPPGAPSEGEPASVTIRDISLDADKALHGQIVDANGVAASGKTVVIRNSEGWEAEAVSDAQGRFRIPELRGGVYAVTAGGPAQVCRVWAPQAAPPIARSELLVIGGDEPVRANFGGCGWRNPWLWAGIIAVAVAIPIIINALDDDAS